MSHKFRQRDPRKLVSLCTAYPNPTSTQFPYALSALPSALKTQWDAPSFMAYRNDFPAEHRSSPEALEAHVRDLTERDVKVAYLKNLQGYLWEDGYKSGAYSTPLFADVVEFFDSWPTAVEDNKNGAEEGTTSEAEGDAPNKASKQSNNTTATGSIPSEPTKQPPPATKPSTEPPRRIAIYSSGSIHAQKLLFAHVQVPSPLHTSSPTTTATCPLCSTTRNLNPHISSYHDTTTAGPKTSASSYTTIAASLGLSATPEKILFLSDIPAEIDAAVEAGMRGVVVEREGNRELSEEERGRLVVVKGLGELGL